MTDSPLGDELRGTTYRLARRLNATDTPGALPQLHRVVLATLDVEDGLTGADIARRERVTPQAVNLALGTLVREGLVERRADPADGRRRVLSLTPEGRAAIRAVREHKSAWLDARLDELTAAERDAVREALVVLRRIADAP